MINISAPIITEKDIKDISEVLRSGMIAGGPKVSELEKEFASYCGTEYAIAVNSGTAALHCALYALGVKKNDEVITTPFTFVATANPILMQNAKIVFADIDEDTFCIDPKEVEAHITPATKALLPVSLYGRPFDQSLQEIAKTNNLKILDDAAQSIGAKVENNMAGNLADISAFSLYATKNIMCGEGGMLTTNDPDLNELCRRFRHHGQSEQTQYEYADIGYNYRMTDILAALALNQIKTVEEITEKRNENAKKLSQGLEKIEGITVPSIEANTRHAFHQFTIRVMPEFKLNRDELKSHLQEHGIGSGIYYPKPLHLHPHFKNLGYKEGDFPVAERVAKEVLSLPVHPSLSPEDIEKIIETIKNI
ncbi:aminotransferase class V-fold PLP-dependent enzyme [Candidatus Peregrinibacteria bacterium]|nr:aminotransferase class V-fold PLP-dependent enzyme [Candidatus Peregrinibacteria bacterium]